MEIHRYELFRLPVEALNCVPWDPSIGASIDSPRELLLITITPNDVKIVWIV